MFETWFICIAYVLGWLGIAIVILAGIVALICLLNFFTTGQCTLEPFSPQDVLPPHQEGR